MAAKAIRGLFTWLVYESISVFGERRTKGFLISTYTIGPPTWQQRPFQMQLKQLWGVQTRYPLSISLPFFFSTRFSSWFSIRTSIDDTSTVNPLPLTVAIQIRIMVLGFLWTGGKRKINGLWIDLFEWYIWREKQSNWFLIHTTTMFTVLKAVALRLWMWNITMESPKTMTGHQAKHSMYIVFAYTVVRRPCQPISLSTENHIYHVCDHSWHLRAGPRLWRRIEPKAAYRICPSALPVPRRHRPGQTDTWDQISSVSCDLLL